MIMMPIKSHIKTLLYAFKGTSVILNILP